MSMAVKNAAQRIPKGIPAADTTEYLATQDIEDRQARNVESVLYHAAQIVRSLESTFGDTVGETRAVKLEGGVFVGKEIFWK